jgi:hypothetical protein
MKHLSSEVKSHPQGSKSFLDYFPDNRRSWVMARFLAVVREGELEPEMIVHRVWAGAQAKTMMPCSDEDRTKYLGLCLAIENHSDAAHSLALYCVEWEALPWHERDSLKREQRDQYRREHIRGLAPTAKQVHLLSRLGGHRTDVSNRQEAADLIDQVLNGKGGGS